MSVFRSKSEILLLEPCDGKLSRTVLRGESARKGADLPAPFRFHPLNQDGWNRKGLVGDRGDRKKAWHVMHDFYMSKKNGAQ